MNIQKNQRLRDAFLVILALFIFGMLLLDGNATVLGYIRGAIPGYAEAETTAEMPDVSTPAPETTARPETTAPPETTALPETTAQPETTTGGETVPAVPSETVTLSFLGLCAPGTPLGAASFGSLNAVAAQQGYAYFFEKLSPMLREDHLTVAANGSLFTDWLSSVTLSCAAPSANAAIYAEAGVELVSLAPLQNDFDGSPDFTATETALGDAGVLHPSEGDVYLIDVADMRIAIVNAWIDRDRNILDDVSRIRSAKTTADVIIVYFFGGETGSAVVEDWMLSQLRQLADAGASYLIGCGSGVLRPVETYNQSVIAHSLGTLFDGASLYSDRPSALFRIHLTRDEQGDICTNYEIIPLAVTSPSWQPHTIEDPAMLEAAWNALYPSSVTPR